MLGKFGGKTVACRPVDGDGIAASIETELQNAIITEISSKDIGEMVLSRLKEQDIISYIRFAAVYREFKDIDSFMQEIKTLAKKPRKRVSAKTADEGEKRND